MIDIYVINLADRPDRCEQIRKDFVEYTNINLIFIDAIKHSNGNIGCTRSFKKCVSIAKEKQMPYIIVAEDDCIPMNNFQNRLKNVLEYLESNDNWQLFLGGVKKSDRISGTFPFSKESIYSIKRGHSAHLCIFHSSIYDYILTFDENTQNADTFWHNNYHALITIPFLAHQRDGFSSIGNRYNGQFTQIYDDTENTLRKSIPH